MRSSACALLVAGLLVSVPTGPVVASDWDPPEGWEMPSKSKLQMEPMREKSPTGYIRAYGDFDGDGAEDTALLLVPESGAGYGIFVFRGDGHGNFGPGLPAIREQAGSVEYLGIERVPPGKYRTACGKGYWDCGPDEPEELDLRTDAISVFTFESASAILYWDGERKAFRLVADSD